MVILDREQRHAVHLAKRLRVVSGVVETSRISVETAKTFFTFDHSAPQINFSKRHAVRDWFLGLKACHLFDLVDVHFESLVESFPSVNACIA